MGNYELKAEVNRLSSQLREIERENAKLRAEINTIVSNVDNANDELNKYNNYIQEKLDAASGTIGYSVNRALSAYELQGEIDRLYTKFKCVELANKKIRTLNNKKYYDFKSYRVVRKIVQGMMDNLDLSMVSDNVIYKSIERQHLLTPDFWLTCVLISIMAWKDDDKILAERAMNKAMQLDIKNSSIFYMIFNLRMDRNEAALKWFVEYKKCDLKGSDEHTFLMLFSLISKTLSDSVDSQTFGQITEYIHKLILDCAQREGYQEEEIIAFIFQHMQNMVKKESYDFPLLTKYCKNYNSVSLMLNLAKNNYNILEFILKVINVPVAERNTYLKEYLNELLEKPNNTEIETYNEIEYNELIIRMSGDVEAAQGIFEEEVRRRESDFNIISTIIQWIYDFNNEDVNGQMRLNMFTLTKTLQEKAADKYFMNYRSLFSPIQPIQIVEYSSDCNFNDLTGEEAKVAQFYESQQQQEIALVKDTKGYIAIATGVALGALSFATSYFLLIGFAIGLTLGGGIIVANQYKRKNIVLKIQNQKSHVLSILQNTFMEFHNMTKLLGEYDQISVKINEELAKL